MIYKHGLALACALVLAACGGGGGADGDGGESGTSAQVTARQSVTADGLYSGSFTENGQTFDITGFVADNEMMLVSFAGGTLEVGNFQLDGSSLTSRLTVYEDARGGADDTVVGRASVNATVVERDSLSGRFTTTYDTSGSFALTYDPLYERASSFDSVAGIWSQTDDDNYTVTVTIQNDGSLSGGDTDGCQYTGSASIIDPTFNLYDFALTIVSCGDGNGNYRGRAALADIQVQNDTLLYAGFGQGVAALGALRRQ